MKVTVFQKSGLGNQLFQYAAGWYYARKYNARLEMVIDREQNASSYGFPRPFLLSNFCVSAPCTPLSLAQRILISTNPRLKTGAAALATIMRAQIVTEPIAKRHTFIPDLPIRHGNVEVVGLVGYWQTFRALETIAEDMRREFRFRFEPLGPNGEMLSRILDSSNSVSLHIRRGDYTLAVEGNRVLSMSYYSRAIELFRARIGNPVFFVFSDDIAYARANLPSDISAVFVSHNDDFRAHEDLRLMSACRHNIIANSSFSWWGAWLNSNSEKIVFAPRMWYANSDSYYPDLLPDTWILDNTPYTDS
jgi:hypothetical protein